MVLFLLTAVILTLLVLIQRGRGGGLAGAFGGAGGSSAFGTKTADVFVKATAVLGAIFFVLSVVTALLMRSSGPAYSQRPNPPTAPAPSQPGMPGPSTPAEAPDKAATPPAAPTAPAAPAAPTAPAAPAAPAAPGGESK
jgi:preprotein translocase subunit SecG